MARLSRLLRSAAENHIAFWCPGCDEAHMVKVGPGGWGFDGNVESPTFTPSVKCTTQYGDGRGTHICHSFVTAGRIDFCGDSTHALAGRSAELSLWPVGYWDGDSVIEEPDGEQRNLE